MNACLQPYSGGHLVAETKDPLRGHMFFTTCRHRIRAGLDTIYLSATHFVLRGSCPQFRSYLSGAEASARRHRRGQHGTASRDAPTGHSWSSRALRPISRRACATLAWYDGRSRQQLAETSERGLSSASSTSTVAARRAQSACPRTFPHVLQILVRVLARVLVRVPLENIDLCRMVKSVLPLMPDLVWSNNTWRGDREDVQSCDRSRVRPIPPLP